MDAHDTDWFEMMTLVTKWFKIAFDEELDLPLKILFHYAGYARYYEEMEWYKLNLKLMSGM